MPPRKHPGETALRRRARAGALIRIAELTEAERKLAAEIEPRKEEERRKREIAEAGGVRAMDDDDEKRIRRERGL